MKDANKYNELNKMIDLICELCVRKMTENFYSFLYLYQRTKLKGCKWDYRLTNAVSYHGAIHADEDEPLLAIVDDECAGECSKMDSWSFLIDLRVAHLENKQFPWTTVRIQGTRLSVASVGCLLLNSVA